MRIDITIDYDPSNQVEALAVDKLLTVLGNAPASMSVTPIESKQDIPRKRVIAEPESKEKPAAIGVARLKEDKTEKHVEALIDIAHKRGLHPDVFPLIGKRLGENMNDWDVEACRTLYKQIRDGAAGDDEHLLAMDCFRNWQNMELDMRATESELQDCVRSGKIGLNPWLLHVLCYNIVDQKVALGIAQLAKEISYDSTKLNQAWQMQPDEKRTVERWKVFKEQCRTQRPDTDYVEKFVVELVKKKREGVDGRSLLAMLTTYALEADNPLTVCGLVYQYENVTRG